MAAVRQGLFAGCFAGGPVRRLAASSLESLVRAGATPQGLEAAGYPDDIVQQLRGALLDRLAKVSGRRARRGTLGVTTGG